METDGPLAGSATREGREGREGLRCIVCYRGKPESTSTPNSRDLNEGTEVCPQLLEGRDTVSQHLNLSRCPQNAVEPVP